MSAAADSEPGHLAQSGLAPAGSLIGTIGGIVGAIAGTSTANTANTQLMAVTIAHGGASPLEKFTTQMYTVEMMR